MEMPLGQGLQASGLRQPGPFRSKHRQRLMFADDRGARLFKLGIGHASIFRNAVEAKAKKAGDRHEDKVQCADHASPPCEALSLLARAGEAVRFAALKRAERARGLACTSSAGGNSGCLPT